MALCVFDNETKRGTVYGRLPKVGEFGVEIPDSQCMSFKSFPKKYLWNDVAQCLVIWPGLQDEEDAKIKDQTWDKIRAERDRRMDGGFRVEVEPDVFKWYHSDLKSRTQHLGLLMAGAAVPPILWKTMDGTFVPMSQSIAQAIFQAAMNLDAGLFATAEQHKAAMEASPDPLAYDYSTGWPENFLGL